MVKLINSDALILQLQRDFDAACKEFIKARDEYNGHKKNPPFVFGHSEYRGILLDDLALLSGLEKKLDTIDHVIRLIESGVYDYNG